MIKLENRIELAKYFNKLGFKKGAEIGVASGRYSEILCRNIPDLELYCVDPWKPYKGNRRGGGANKHSTNYQKAVTRLSNYNVKFLQMLSMEAVGKIPDGYLDFVFIDGNHSFDYIMRDLIEWSKKVKKGGIISGHDYYKFRYAGIVEAVNAYTNAHKLTLNVIDWWPQSGKDDSKPCFWWVK